MVCVWGWTLSVLRLPFGQGQAAMGQLACCPKCQQAQSFLLGLGGLAPSEPLSHD